MDCGISSLKQENQNCADEVGVNYVLSEHSKESKSKQELWASVDNVTAGHTVD